MKRMLWLLIFLMTGAVLFHQQVREAVLLAGERCLTVLIPSLYFFTILATLLVLSGILETGNRRLLGLDTGMLAVVLFAQIGGYPVGAQLLHTMRENGSLTKEQECRMLCVCMGCGPGFLLGTVCSNVPLSVGLWMLLSVSLPNLTAALFLMRDISTQSESKNSLPFVQQLTVSVERAAASMLKISGMVMTFAAVMGIFSGILAYLPPLPERVQGMLRSFFEVSSLTEYMHAGGTLPMAAALLSFGGICVHLQMAAICEGNFPYLPFWGFRLGMAAVSWGICRIGMQFLFPQVRAVSLAVQMGTAFSSGSIVPGLCLLVMSVLLLRKRSQLV